MADGQAIDSTSVTERLVLYELAELAERDETPAGAVLLLGSCRDRLADLDGVVGGKLTEADLVRTCRSLADSGLVAEEKPDATSPVGKGRPAYDLAVDPGAVRGTVREDDRFEGLPAGDG